MPLQKEIRLQTLHPPGIVSYIFRTLYFLLVTVTLFVSYGAAGQTIFHNDSTLPDLSSFRQTTVIEDKRINYQTERNQTLLHEDSTAYREHYLHLARTALQDGRYFNAIQYGLKAIYHARENEAEAYNIAVAANITGMAYSRTGNLAQATSHYMNAALYKERIPESPVTLSEIYNNLGTVMPGWRQALQYFEKAYETAAKENATDVMGMALQNQSLIYEQYGTYEQADRCIQASYTLGQRHNDQLLMYISHMRWANSYQKRKQPEKALAHIRTAETFLPQIKIDINDEILHETKKGEIYLLLKNYPLAERYFLTAWETAIKYRSIIQQVVVSKALAGLYEEKNDCLHALVFQKHYSRLKDSILNENISQGVSSLEVQYRIHEKDKALAKKKRELLTRNYLIAAISGGILLLSALFYLFYRHSRQKQKMLRQEKEIGTLKALMEGEETERSRIAGELHDGVMVSFSSAQMHLNALLNQMPDDEKNTDKLKTAITQFEQATAELRRSAHNLMPELLLREGLFGAVSYFCSNIQQHVPVEFQQYGTLPAIQPEYQLMLYRIIQELVQNALKHAEATQIIVQLDVVDDCLYITIEDNGKGFEVNGVDGKTHMGLHKIRSRVLSLNGTINIRSAKTTGTSIYIELALSNLQA